MGSQALFSPEWKSVWQEIRPSFASIWGYRSNWRLLHVDKFETAPEFRLPPYTGDTHYYFHYTLTPKHSSPEEIAEI